MLRAAKARLAAMNAKVDLARTHLAQTRLYSPLSGIVLVRDAEEGEILPAGTPVLTIGDLERVWLRAYLEEPDLGRVKIGQRVLITTDSYPDKTYEGLLSHISQEAEFTPKNVQTQRERVKLVYRIKVEIPNPSLELKPGMPADCVIPIVGSGISIRKRIPDAAGREGYNHSCQRSL